MKRLIVGMAGSTGAIYGVRLLEALRQLDVESHLVMSKWAERTIEHETPYTVDQVKAMATCVHSLTNQGASISSGSFLTAGMAIMPCSMKTLAAVAHGFSDNLVHRAADVILKERRKLVVVARETPLSSIHLENMLKLSNLGAVILPPMPAFYNHPQTLDDIVDHVVARVLDQFGFHWDRARRWDGKMERLAGEARPSGAANSDKAQ